MRAPAWIDNGFPTRAELLEFNRAAVVAACRSVLSTSSPVQHTLADFVGFDRAHFPSGALRDRKKYTRERIARARGRG
jgi:hypothetical protein